MLFVKVVLLLRKTDIFLFMHLITEQFNLKLRLRLITSTDH